MDAGLCSEGTIFGVTDEEITALEHQLGLRFPRAYKEYLLIMGRGAGDLFVGWDIFPEVPDIAEDAIEVIRE